MALTDIGGTLSEQERIQLINTLVFLVRTEYPSVTSVRDVNLVTIQISSDRYRIDVTSRKGTIIFGWDVRTRIEVLEGLRDAIEKRAAQVILETSGPRNGRVLAKDQPKSHRQDPKASSDSLKHETDKFLTKKADGDFGSLDAMFVKDDNNHQTRIPFRAGRKRKAQDQNECTRKKSKGDDCVMNDEILGETEEERMSDHEGHKEAMDSHIEGEPEDIEEEDPPPSVSAVLAGYVAGERRGRKWRGRTADMPMRHDMDGIAEGNVSDDEQVIIGEDSDFWRER
ncbi:uncharacterized protein J4E79_007989 [Alternaria viburni]|uniref:uncharacterized protein n=1 Tax=Alternaria viburni TaxID=566460 RepID=UPI0020C1E461|nr:uncharacterized protein J4E79_007989 [Alternaria viburni]KAI4656435.1 hypothetical protein J4E79_007989 [Alternaria viburni]